VEGKIPWFNAVNNCSNLERGENNRKCFKKNKEGDITQNDEIAGKNPEIISPSQTCEKVRD